MKWDKICDNVIQNDRINRPLNIRMERSTVLNVIKKSKANDVSWYREGVR